jgi:hypothetical protein
MNNYGPESFSERKRNQWDEIQASVIFPLHLNETCPPVPFISYHRLYNPDTMRLSLPNFALLTLLVFSNASAAVAVAAAAAATTAKVPSISSSSLSPMDAYHFGTTIVQRLRRTGRQLTATTNQAASQHQASSQSVKAILYGEQQQQQHRRLAEVLPENDLSFIAPKTKPTTGSTTAATFALVPRTLNDESSSPMDAHHTTMHSAPVLRVSLDPQGQQRRRLTAVEVPEPFQTQPISSTVPRTTATTTAAAASNDKDEDATSSPLDAFHATLFSSPHLRRGRRLAQARPSLVQDSSSSLSSLSLSPMDALHWHHWLSWSTTAATRTTTTTSRETEPPTMQPPRDDHLRRHSAGPILAAAPAASDRTATVSTLDQRTDATPATAPTTTVRTTRLLTVRDAWPALSQLHWSTIAIVFVCGALGVVAMFTVVFAMIYDLLGCCAKNQDDDDTDRKSCHRQRKSWFHQDCDPTEDQTSANVEDCDELEDDHTDCGFITQQAVMGLPPGVDPRLYHAHRPGRRGSHPQCDTHHAALPLAIALKRRSTTQRKPWLPDIESHPPPASGRLSLPAIDEAETFDSIVDETRPKIVRVAAPRDHTASTTTTPPLFSNLFQLVSALERAHGSHELHEDSSVISADSLVSSAPRQYGGGASILSASSSNVSPLVLFATDSTVGGHGDDEDTTSMLGLPSNTDSDNHSHASMPSLVVRVPLDSETSSRTSLASCGEEISAASTVEYHFELSAHQRAAWEEFQRQSSSSPSSNDSDHNCVNDDERSEQRKRARSALSLAVQSDLRHIVGHHVPIKLILGEQVEI